MILAALLNALLGAVCGLRFRVLILAPLSCVALIEIFLLGTVHEGWLSCTISAVALILALEIGYFVGAVLGSSRLFSDRPLPGRKWGRPSLMRLFPGSHIRI